MKSDSNKDSIIKNVLGKSFTDDLSIIFKNKDFKIRNMVNYSTIFQEYSEYNIKNYQNGSKFVLNSFVNKINPIKKTVSGVKRIGDKKSSIVYINGMMTDEDVAIYQLEYLMSILGQSVELIYNHTEGFFKDIIECSIDRHGHDITEATISTISIIKEKILLNEDVFILGHSQGSIIATSALKILREELSISDLKRIKYITFGAGFKNCDISDFIYTEHYANTKDPIVHLGLLDKSNNIKGEIYTRDIHGHMFVADYLYPIKSGQFGFNGLFAKMINV